MVGRALETTRLRREVKQLRANEARPYSLRAIVGESVDDGGAAADGRESRGEPGIDGAAHRRERHRQGSGRQDHPLQQRARLAAVHEHHLLGAARSRCSRASCSGTSAARSPMRACRSAACSRAPTAARSSSTRLARWSRAAGQAAAVPGGEELQARRRRRRHPGRRPRRRGDEPESRGAGRQGRVPQRSLLPAQRPADPPAGAARACRGRARPGQLLRRQRSTRSSRSASPA